MTPKQMEEFIGLINNGLDALGEPHPKIAAFNKAIKAAVPKVAAAPSKIEDIIAAGRKYMKTSRFRLLAAGALVSGLLGEVLQQHVNGLEVAATSKYYKGALQALQGGDLNRAQALLIGGRDSLYLELLSKVGAHAAMTFQHEMENVFAGARKNAYK